MNYVLKNQEGLLPAGHVIAANQLVLKEYEAPALEIANAKETNLDVVEPEIRTENYNYLVVEGENFTIEFNRRTGYLSIYQVNGVDYIKEGEALVPNFWRAGVLLRIMISVQTCNRSMSYGRILQSV